MAECLHAWRRVLVITKKSETASFETIPNYSYANKQEIFIWWNFKWNLRQMAPHCFTSCFAASFDRKWVSTAFLRHEVESVLREDDQLICTLFSAYNSFDEILPFLRRRRSKIGHPHTASPKCTDYKCDRFLIMDGDWNIRHPYCAATVQVTTWYPFDIDPISIIVV